jgi:hypothetical protein
MFVVDVFEAVKVNEQHSKPGGAINARTPPGVPTREEGAAIRQIGQDVAGKSFRLVSETHQCKNSSRTGEASKPHRCDAELDNALRLTCHDATESLFDAAFVDDLLQSAPGACSIENDCDRRRVARDDTAFGIDEQVAAERGFGRFSSLGHAVQPTLNRAITVISGILLCSNVDCYHSTQSSRPAKSKNSP